MFRTKRYCDYDYDNECLIFFDADDSISTTTEDQHSLNITWLSNDDSRKDGPSRSKRGNQHGAKTATIDNAAAAVNGFLSNEARIPWTQFLQIRHREKALEKEQLQKQEKARAYQKWCQMNAMREPAKVLQGFHPKTPNSAHSPLIKYKKSKKQGVKYVVPPGHAPFVPNQYMSPTKKSKRMAAVPSHIPRQYAVPSMSHGAVPVSYARQTGAYVYAYNPPPNVYRGPVPMQRPHVPYSNGIPTRQIVNPPYVMPIKHAIKTRE